LHLVRNDTGRPLSIGAAVPVAERPTSAPAPDSAATAAASPTRATEAAGPEGVIVIRAPMLGTFYRAPAPGQKPFVEVGQRVRADDTVCLIEVMKLFNSIRAGVDGEIFKIMAENASMVEFNQPLIFIFPEPRERPP
jgi:acetyl-CoA carboxylase biotin carboxyl carrier protein